MSIEVIQTAKDFPVEKIERCCFEADEEVEWILWVRAGGIEFKFTGMDAVRVNDRLIEHIADNYDMLPWYDLTYHYGSDEVPEQPDLDVVPQTVKGNHPHRKRSKS